jgi:hypothetical protein
MNNKKKCTSNILHVRTRNVATLLKHWQKLWIEIAMTDG